ncbi:type II secretion system F family protein [Arthrobacter sp. NPDC058130]|uniref:type II secretion system F family protein n=1 Tax=Arthrobacter sp. NPDC058130 TaxID=3346353 RepID=UPI0036E80862
MTVVVQQLAALLKGGRIPARLWDELWVLYGGDVARDWSAGRIPANGAGRDWGHNRGNDRGHDWGRDSSGPTLGPESLRALAAARAAALRGSSVAAAIRRELAAGPGSGRTIVAVAMGAGGVPAGRDVRVWGELAACFDIAEASGCPLADVLARFAAHLETEDDAEAARQTALAGPRATVRLLTCLPVSGLGLGLLLGVDPVAALLGHPWGLASVAAGVVLTAVGRLWSIGLVRAAVEAQS